MTECSLPFPKPVQNNLHNMQPFRPHEMTKPAALTKCSSPSGTHSTFTRVTREPLATFDSQRRGTGRSTPSNAWPST